MADFQDRWGKRGRIKNFKTEFRGRGRRFTEKITDLGSWGRARLCNDLFKISGLHCSARVEVPMELYESYYIQGWIDGWDNNLEDRAPFPCLFVINN